MPNIEIKAHYKNLEKAHEIAQSLGATYVGLDHQIDTYFITPHGRFKLRESSLSGATLIPYIRADQHAAKKSDYALINVDKNEALHVKNLFTQMLGIDVVVDKKRDIYLIDNVRVHLDTVKDLGTFFEFEAVYKNDTPENRDQETTKVQQLMQSFEIKPDDLIQGSYREMMKNHNHYSAAVAVAKRA